MHLNHTLALIALMGSLTGAALAQQPGHKVYDFTKQYFNISDKYGEQYNTFLFGTFSHVSANGKYAVGTDDELMFRSYLWRADAPETIEMMGSYDSEIALYDVTNDGTLIGGIRDNRGMMYPAYKPQGASWQMLTRGMENLNRDMAMDDYVNQALRCASPDGRYMAGSFYINTGQLSDAGTMVSHLVPVVWEDGKLKKIYDDLGINEFMVWDISDDGRTLVGMNVAGIGGQNPAIIRDGKLIELFDCGEERTFDTPDDVYGNTEGGICNSIDNQGNVYGYFVEPLDDYTSTIFYFIVPADCDYAIFLNEGYTDVDFPNEYWQDSWYRCGGNGMHYSNEDSHLLNLLDCSDDGRVMVGGGAANLGFGIANIPQVCVFDEPLCPGDVRLEAVKEATKAHGISVGGRSVIVKGVYTSASIFDAKGNLVVSGGQGQPLALPEGHGVYVINVKYTDGTKSYRFAN